MHTATLKKLLYIVSLLFIAYFVYKFKDSFELLNKLNIYYVGLLMLITMTMANLQSLQFLRITRILKQDVSWKNIAGITFISTMYNNILPAGGAVAVRAALLKKVTGIAWSDVTALMSIYYMVSYLSMSLLLLFASSIAYQQKSIEFFVFISALLICLGVMAIILFFFIFSFSIPDRNKLTAFLNRTIQSVALYKYRYKDHLKIGLYQLIIVLFTGIRLYLSFYFLGITIDFWKLIFIQSFISFSLVFSLTPGNLGIKEGLIVLFASFLVIDEDVALVGSLVDRGVGLISVLILGVLGKLWFLIRFK